MPYTLSKAYSYIVGCPKGYHKRKSYKSVKGKTVPTRCVKSTTVKNESSKELKQTRRLASAKKLLPGIKTLRRQACPPGMIERKEYARRYSTAVLQKGFTKKTNAGKTIIVKPHKRSLAYVKSKCVKDVGLPGKGNQKIGPLHKGELTKHGYQIFQKDKDNKYIFESDNKTHKVVSEEKRHKALRSAIREYGALGVYRKLDAVVKLSTRTTTQGSKLWEKDRNWVKETFSLKAF
uniref:Uncharacterized protein n=1 Tax=viral metagenome TaxID=1070528 RepID=A0A6C0D601_9ZZZZ